MSEKYTEINVRNSGEVEGKRGETMFRGNFSLLIIQMAYNKGCSFDEYVPVTGDWSFIRDADDQAHNLMLAKALNFIDRL
jgi:hypothetical protein